jgi:hypothetical protein
VSQVQRTNCAELVGDSVAILQKFTKLYKSVQKSTCNFYKS